MSEFFAITAPPFLYSEGGKIVQAILLRALRDIDGALVEVAGMSTYRLTDVRQGSAHRLPLRPALKIGEKADVIVRVRGESVKEVLELPVVRELTLHVFHHAHQDSGWADRPSILRERMTGYLDVALAEVERTQSYADGAQFRWNVESAFLVKDWLESAGSTRRDALFAAARAGAIEIGALFCGLHTDLASLEELCQVAAYAHQLRATHRLPVRSAFLNDVPGLAWSLPSVLVASGIDQIVWGPDPIRSLAHKAGRPPLFHYKGAEGSSALTWQSPYAYIEAWPLASTAVEEWDHLVERLVRPYAAANYPWKNALLHTAHDFNSPSLSLSDAVAAWNIRWASPRIRLSTASDFFRDVRAEGVSPPIFSGPSPDPWTDGVGSLAAATGVKRIAERTLVDAVKYATLAQRLDVSEAEWHARIAKMFPPTAMRLAKRPWFDYPTADIENAFEALLMVDEHTFGSVEASRPNRGLGRAHWLEKERHYDDLRRLTEILDLEGAERLGREAATPGERSIVVLNPSSWDRSGVVEVAIPADWGRGALYDHGEIAPTEWHGREEDAALARVFVSSVPSLGYRRLTHQDHPPNEGLENVNRPPDEPGPHAIASDWYSLEIDERGSARSLVDRVTGHELVDAGAPYGLGQLVLITREDVPISIPEDFNDSALTGQEVWDVAADLGRFMRERSRVLPRVERVRRESSPLGERLVVDQRIDEYGRLTTTFVLHHLEPHIEVRATLTKNTSLEREAAYICFPFNVSSPRSTVEGPGYTFAPGDQMTGSSHDHYPVHEWVACSGREATIVLAPIEAPLLSVGGMHVDRWLTAPEGPPSHFYSYILNSSWWTNFPLTQFGTLSFSYRLTTLEPGASQDMVARAGSGLAHPMRAVSINPEHAYGTLPSDGSFVRVEPASASVTAAHVLDPRSSGDLLVRVLETAGQAQSVAVSFPTGRGQVESASRASMFGEPTSPLEVLDGAVYLPLRPREIASIRVRFAARRGG